MVTCFSLYKAKNDRDLLAYSFQQVPLIILSLVNIFTSQIIGLGGMCPCTLFRSVHPHYFRYECNPAVKNAHRFLLTTFNTLLTDLIYIYIFIFIYIFFGEVCWYPLQKDVRPTTIVTPSLGLFCNIKF